MIVQTTWANGVHPLGQPAVVPFTFRLGAKPQKPKVHPNGLSKAQVRLLVAIVEHGPLSRTGMRARLNTGTSTISRGINKLLDEQLIQAETVKGIKQYRSTK